MFNACDRGAALDSVYNDPRLSQTWRVLSFSYSTPLPLLILDHGTVIDTLSSATGGRQGDVLAGLLCSRLFQSVYEECIADLPSLTGRAIMDDFSVAGAPAEVFTAVDRFRTLAAQRHVSMSPKTVIQQPHGDPAPSKQRATATCDWCAVTASC